LEAIVVSDASYTQAFEKGYTAKKLNIETKTTIFERKYMFQTITFAL